MKLFTTKMRKHCYYGSITNILNYYDEKTSEAELVLLSNALNCKVQFKNNCFLGISNKLCLNGLEQIGYKVKYLGDNYVDYSMVLNSNSPILLMANTEILTYDNVYEKANRKHYIVLLKDGNEFIEMSDCLIYSIPEAVYQGSIDKKQIKSAIETNRASGVYLEKIDKRIKNQYSVNDILLNYVKANASISDKSVINNLYVYCDMILDNIETLLNRESLFDISYDIKVEGIIARFDYLIELFENYFKHSVNIEPLKFIKNKWELVAKKLMKCSVILNKGYFLKLFEVEIPELINKELNFYQELRKG